MSYLALKCVHVAAVVVSFVFFTTRGFWMITGSPLLHTRFARVAPHVVDTVLLASAIGLIVILRQYPLVQPWLTAKVLGLLVYIGLGTIALKRGRTRAIRIAALISAIAVFLWIVATARGHTPWLPV